MVEREIDSFYESNENNQFTESAKVVPVPEKLVYPDESKSNWKQTDLLREMNRELLDSSNINFNRKGDTNEN